MKRSRSCGTSLWVSHNIGNNRENLGSGWREGGRGTEKEGLGLGRGRPVGILKGKPIRYSTKELASAS